MASWSKTVVVAVVAGNELLQDMILVVADPLLLASLSIFKNNPA